MWLTNGNLMEFDETGLIIILKFLKIVDQNSDVF